MSDDRVDCVVIGAGVVGLAIAREVAQRGRETVILEADSHFGGGISSRNSEVVHAGLYYPTNTLKARLCVTGKALLYDYCDTHHIEVRRCGKLVVATDDSQIPTLDKIAAQAAVNGVSDVTKISSEEAAELEPEIHCVSALHSPSTGVIDSHGLMLSLLGEAEQAGAMIAYDAAVEKITRLSGGFSITLMDDSEASLVADQVIIAAGLGSTDLMQRSKLVAGSEYQLPQQVLAKGNYFKLDAKPPVERLIYPVPETGGLGVHITLDLAGRVRFGPDVEWLDSSDADQIDYTVSAQRADVFYAAIRRYWPGLPDDALLPDYAGVRPKLCLGADIQTDFHILGPEDHGCEGLVTLLGIESPGLTSSRAIAQYATDLLSN
ncbi:MAG: NAD(P)/FAD-dependent oxidoreductase [Granulosicoccus sp.]|nr:NAD(P)/FAD-dependent oxidoreductase [Granulosicoccus sp.]